MWKHLILLTIMSQSGQEERGCIMAKSSIATAYVQVIPSAQGITGKLSGIFGSEGQNAGVSFGSSLISNVKKLLVTAGLGKAMGESLKAGAGLQQSLGGIETLFKSSANTVIANAEQAYKTAGLSANSYMEMVTGFSASLLQGLGGNTAKAAAVADMALTDMSDNANKMGTSMDLIQNAYQGFAKQNYTMLDNLKLGYGGTKTEMERLLADAQKLTGVKYDISNLSDVYEAIHVIQDDLGITGTTAKESAETFSGSLASMKAAAANVLGKLSLGEDIGPSLNALADTVYTFVVGNLLPMVGNVLSSLPEVLSSAFSMGIQGLNLVADNADALLEQGISLVTGIGSSIITALPYLAEAAMNVVTALGTAIITTDWIQIGTDMINSLKSSLDLAAGEILGTDGSIVQSVLDSIAANLPAVLDGGVDLILELVDGLWKAAPTVLTTIGELLVQLLAAIMDTLPSMLESGFELIAGLAEGMLENLPSIISAGMDIIADLLTEFASHLPELLEQGITLIGEFAAGLIEAIPEVVSAADDIVRDAAEAFSEFDWAQLGKDIVNGLIKGLGAMGSALWTAAKNVAKTALDSIKDFLGIASPSKVMRDQVGKYIPAGIAVGITANAAGLQNAMDDLSDMTVDSMKASLKISDACTAAAAPVKSYGNFSLTVHVHGAEGQSVDKLADAVMQKIQSAVNSEEVVFA